MHLTITMTATWRAELAATALASLERFVLPHFDLVRLLVNIDPIYGDADPYSTTEKGARSNPAVWFKQHLDADVLLARENEFPSHGQAIKTLWTQAGYWTPDAGYFLHWEDDFEALVDITPEMVEETRQHHCGMGAFWYERLGSGHGKTWKTDSHGNAILGTSPRFVHAAFGRDYAHHIDPTLCPEKQTYPKHRTAPWEAFMDRRHTLAADRDRPWARAHILRAREPVVKVEPEFADQGFIVQQDKPMVRHLGHEWNRLHGITRTQEGGRIVRVDAAGRELS